MTESEKQRYRDKKAEIVRNLSQMVEVGALTRYSYAIQDTDTRLLDYVLAVINNPDVHNIFELAKIQRYFQMLDRWRWNADRVRRFIRFYEMIRFNGFNGRQRYKLTPVQAFQYANIFGFSREDGRRLIRTAYIFVPRKFSKTTSAAALAVYDLLFGDANAQAYVGANSYNQAKICFDEIRAIMRDLDPREKHFRVNREKITFKDGSRDSLAACLTNNAKTQDGLHASLVIMDEYAAARNTAGKGGADLRNVLQTSMGPRREPLLLIITTASDVIDGPFYHELEGVKQVLLGETVNDMIFADLFMPDVDDDEGDPNTWAKVQPHLGITVQKDYYEIEYANSRLSSENALAFRTKLLNIFTVNEQKTWFTPERARELVAPFNIDKVQGKPDCFVAFDLSIRDDFSAVSYLLYDHRYRKFYCHTDSYLPSATLNWHPNRELYRAWHSAGHLKLCGEEIIDVRAIANDILHRASTLNILQIGYDSYSSQELTNILIAAGGRKQLKAVSQNYGNFNMVVEDFELAAFCTPPKIIINDNPINVYCLSNCVIDEGTMENRKPVKISQNRKIDGAITMLMSLWLNNNYEH